jgi:hypothetical protein
MSHSQTATQLLNELREFASFPPATQRYIRRSLDIGLGRRDAFQVWARTAAETAAIRTQYVVYQDLKLLRTMLPDGPAADGMERFMGALIRVTAFDLGQDRLDGFSAYRFLYERCWAQTCALAAGGVLRGGGAAADPPVAPKGLAAIDQRGGGHGARLVHPRAHVLSRFRAAGRSGLTRRRPALVAAVPAQASTIRPIARH